MNLADNLWTNPNAASPGPDYPAWRWNLIEPLLPEIQGKRCLDVGCSSGFFSLKLKELGAGYVLGIDDGEQTRAIEQAQFAAECLHLGVEFKRISVYDLRSWEVSFDVVLFLGILYHLKHPLLALESIRKVCNGKLVLQTITTPHPRTSYQACPEPQYQHTGLRSADLNDAALPLLRFIEGGLDGDTSCWFVPSPEAVLAMLRSCGFEPQKLIFPTEHEMIVTACVS